jgi:hypothetical protein
LTEHYNGTAWTIEPSINPGTLGPLIESDVTSVAATGPGSVLAVGYQGQLGQCCAVTLSLAGALAVQSPALRVDRGAAGQHGHELLDAADPVVGSLAVCSWWRMA